MNEGAERGVLISGGTCCCISVSWVVMVLDHLGHRLYLVIEYSSLINGEKRVGSTNVVPMSRQGIEFREWGEESDKTGCREPPTCSVQHLMKL